MSDSGLGVIFGVGASRIPEYTYNTVAVTNPRLNSLLDAQQQSVINRFLNNELTQEEQYAIDALELINPTIHSIIANNPAVAGIFALSETIDDDTFKAMLFAEGNDGQAVIAGGEPIMAGASGPSREENIANVVAALTNRAGILGAQVTPEQINSLAAEAVDNNYGDALLLDKLLDIATISEFLPGEIAANTLLIKASAAGYRFDISDEDAQNLAIRLASGELTEAGISYDLRAQAIEANPEYASILNAGLSISDYEGKYETIRQSAVALGIRLTDEQVAELSRTSLVQEMTDEELRSVILDTVTDASQLMSGTITEVGNNLRTTGIDFLSPISEADANAYALRIARGELTEQDVIDTFRDGARARFGFASSAIDRGLTVRDYLLPTLQMVGNVLERSVDSFDLADPNTLNMFIDESSGDARALSMSETLRAARRRPEWAQTDNAKNQAASVGYRIAQLFGRSGI